MKLFALAGACALAGLLSLPAAAHTVVYTTTLSGANESPANNSLGTGSVVVTVDLDILSMRVEATFSNMTATDTAAHIHCCLVPNGPLNVIVATPLPSFPNFPLGVTSGTYDQTFDLSQTSSLNPGFVSGFSDYGTALNAFLNGLDAGNAYFNIHSSFAPGGEIRGFLHAAPEPGSLALLALGLGALALRARRA